MDTSYFRLSETDFGIGKVSLAFSRQKGVLNLEITGRQDIAQSISNEQAGPFNWILYPPKLYFWEVPYSSTGNVITIVVNEQLLNEYDVALYLLEHNDIEGILTIDAITINFEGTAQLEGETILLSIHCENSLVVADYSLYL